MSDVLEIRSHDGPYTVSFVSQMWAMLESARTPHCHYLIDSKVAGLYEEELESILEGASVLKIQALEGNKSLERLPDYVEHLVSAGIRRDHKLVAIGGGIIQDITCFLASTMLRGVAWEFVPTTLLAQADSCIGSKSSINSGGAKNILGTFKPPQQVLISTEFQKTLQNVDIRSGIGEMLKVHVIDGSESFNTIGNDYDKLSTKADLMLHYIKRSLEIKKGYIEEDEFDQGPRNIFNYGHTFGHAIEAATDFAIPHGIAVTIGMDMANFVSSEIGFGSESNFLRMHPIMKKNYFDFETHPINLDAFMSAIRKDKKNVGQDNVTLVLVDTNGVVRKTPHPADHQFTALCDRYLSKIRST